LIESSLKALRTLVTQGRAPAHPVVVTFGVKAVLPDKNKKRRLSFSSPNIYRPSIVITGGIIRDRSDS
jgi:hypothetical protein